MSPIPRVEVALKLTGTAFSPDDVTRIVDLKPTKTWRLGDGVQASLLKRKSDGWLLGLPQRRTHDMEGMLCELLDMIEPKAKQIAEAANRFTLDKEISFAVFIRGGAPAASFTADTVRRIAALGASLDIDIL